MGSLLDGLIDTLAGLRIHLEVDGYTYVLVQLQETTCWMMNTAEIQKIAPSVALSDKLRPTQSLKQSNILLNVLT